MSQKQLRGGMAGIGMIFDETYRPFFESAHKSGLYDRAFGDVDVQLSAVSSRTGTRAEAYRASAPEEMMKFTSVTGEDSIRELLKDEELDFVCVATPDDRHFEIAREVLKAGKHLLVEKPSVLDLHQVDELTQLAEANQVLAKVVYHKLLDPDHKKLRTLVQDGVLKHVNNGYCTLLEPKLISGSQFSQWITGRNPGTYVAVHYIKLIDYTFGGKLKTITATGQRGLVGDKDGSTWDSVQQRLVYEYEDGREAAFDIHTSWVTPDNFPGYVEQEVQFRFDNGNWNGHSRKRGVELTVEEKTPFEMKQSINNHYNGTFVEPWGERSQRGYGIEVIERFARELAFVKFGGDASAEANRLEEIQQLSYNDLSADRQVVAAVHALESILEHAANGQPDGVVRVNDEQGGLVLYLPGISDPKVLYSPQV
ncbi:Gfo/Idh/MocA family oxidoreductase [Planctomicrobium sp.]|jgi:D-galacturonate reductase|nr:Gfo/Idh/MocA family oxidoreductase [Planctomicrobium sp.]MDB4733611.1 Gfo/Idh/MocA family oxidoreductase [Planctomicrobium sp.]MDB4743106.1 Gfo/Idh/MocA family oxidoreductase [Planctomicrobium sp.]